MGDNDTIAVDLEQLMLQYLDFLVNFPVIGDSMTVPIWSQAAFDQNAYEFAKLGYT
uniref:Uncharacterized protein n=1 Tax=Arundo donax TaxID=35708 RepID=A0A0A8ZZ54_ARUDO